MRNMNLDPKLEALTFIRYTNVNHNPGFKIRLYEKLKVVISDSTPIFFKKNEKFGPQFMLQIKDVTNKEEA